MDIFVFIAALLVLFYSGGVMVRSLIWIGRYFKVSEYALSLILVAFATSLPELFVGINSAIDGVQDLSLGDLIGANVLNVTLVLGIAMLLAGKRLVFEHRTTRKDFYVTVTILVLPVILLSDGVFSRPDGLVLLLAFIAYASHVLRGEHASPAVNNVLVKDLNIKRFLNYVFQFITGAALLVLSSYILVATAKSVAASYEVPLFALGILVALGTTLPEVVFSARSVFLGHSGMSLGNAIGSVIFNITFILGLVAVLNPFAVQNPMSLTGSLLLPLLFIILIQTVGILRGHFSRTLGLLLIFSSLVFVVLESGL